MIHKLFKINDIIDLCIDRELFDDLDEIICLSAESHARKFINRLREAKGKKSLYDRGDLELDPDQFTVSEIVLPVSLAGASLVSQIGTRLSLSGDVLLESWSYLFFAKRIRAELQKNSKMDWDDRYDDLVFFLETHMPTARSMPSISEKELYCTTFIYLMELSALALGEASLGYAERARRILEHIFPPKGMTPDQEKEKNQNDRWIWLNMGLAYQHTGGRDRLAVLNFNQVLKDFWKEIGKPQNTIKGLSDKPKNDNILLEFLLNICHAVMQRASVQLKMQLAYHALQTLADRSVSQWLDFIRRSEIILFSKAATHIDDRISLLRIEALLQLEQLSQAEHYLEKAYISIFPKYAWSAQNFSLPDPLLSHKSVHTQLVEHTVTWFLQKVQTAEAWMHSIPEMRRLLSDIENIYESSILFKKIEAGCFQVRKDVENITQMISAVKRQYWEWVEDNACDRRIYFSGWAQLLRVVSETLSKIRQFNCKYIKSNKYTLKVLASKSEYIINHLTESFKLLLASGTELYLFQRARIPCPRPKPNDGDEKWENYRVAFELENLRSDDLPEVKQGLTAFYEEISHESYHTDELEDLLINVFSTVGHNMEDPFCLFQNDHFHFLSALDQYEEEFGENQQIHALKRCNERLIWLDENKYVSSEQCWNCLEGDSHAKRKFRGLLNCNDAQERISRNIQKVLDHKDYESIMLNAEDSFTAYLKMKSVHYPFQRALHFIGLQRWNSMTPAQGRSVGGGYFIYRTDEAGKIDIGIAIDPGFDFVRNFFRMGFSLRDIDVVLISHAHPDHLWDFESMIHLLHELEEKEHITHRINVVLTLGSYHRLEHIINSRVLRRFVNPLVIDILKDIEPEFFKELGYRKLNYDKDSDILYKYCFSFYDASIHKDRKLTDSSQKDTNWLSVLPGIPSGFPEITIWPTRAYHDDHTKRSDSFGFVIDFKTNIGEDNNDDIRFGYTGDTKWVGNDLYNCGCPGQSLPCQHPCDSNGVRWQDVASQYTNCDIILIHLGSLIDHKRGLGFRNYRKPYACERLMRKENHPYLVGMIRFLRELQKQVCRLDYKEEKIILIGEFGEELRGGIRADLVRRLQTGVVKSWPVLPVDVGLDLILYKYKAGPYITNEATKDFSFLCALCDKYCGLGEATYFKFGQDEALFHICQTCDKSTPDDVRQIKLRHLYEIGRTLHVSRPNRSD